MYLNGQYCPVARASEILADRWTPLIVRELLAGLRHFNDLDRGLPGISWALLVERLRRLERMGIVERRVPGMARAHDARRGDARRPRPDRRDARRRARLSALVRLEPHGGRRARRPPRACDGDGVGMSAPGPARAAAGSA